MYAMECIEQHNLKPKRKNIEAIETWCRRRALKFPCTEIVKNEKVYLRINEWKTIGEERKTHGLGIL